MIELDFSQEEVKMTGEYLARALNDELTDQEKAIFEFIQNSDELTDDDLEAVSGGMYGTIAGTASYAIAKCMLGAAVAFPVAAAVLAGAALVTGVVCAIIYKW